MSFFRNGTLDGYIYASVLHKNEYNIDAWTLRDKTVLDIGAHIGAFSFLCLINGAKRVLSYEPDLQNYLLMKRNLEKFDEDTYEIHNMAVWRSDLDDHQKLKYSGYFENTGGGNVFYGKSKLEDQSESYEIDSISLDTIIEKEEKEIDLLKIDCEFSEYPVLMTSKKLDKVREIVGEFHEIGGEHDNHTIPDFAKIGDYDKYNIDILKDFLESQGFSVSYNRGLAYKHLGVFKAKRNS